MRISLENSSESEILETHYRTAVQTIEEKCIGEIADELKECIDIFIHGIDPDRSLPVLFCYTIVESTTFQISHESIIPNFTGTSRADSTRL